MSEVEQNAQILDALESAGLAERYEDQDGNEVLRLTEEGAAMARELGILDHGPGVSEAAEPTAERPPEPSEPLDLTGGWGSVVGSAMLGFEQALRSEPPPETVAGEHVPERGISGEDEGVIIEFPDDLPRRQR